MLDIIKQHDINKYRVIGYYEYELSKKINLYFRFRNGNKLGYLWTKENDKHYYVMGEFGKNIRIMSNPPLRNDRPYKKLSLALTRLQEFLEQ